MMSNPLVNPPRGAGGAAARAAVSAQDNRWLRCDIKSISLLGNCLLRQLSAEAGAAETILFRDGKLTEASASNVFIVKRGVILSPPKNNLILPGITYDVVVELAQRATACRSSSATSRRPRCAAPTRSGSPRRRRKCWPSSRSTAGAVGDGRPGPRVPAHVPALPGLQAEGDARRQARGGGGRARLR